MEHRTLLALISGTVFFDVNADGQRNQGVEFGQVGIAVYLDQDGDGLRGEGETRTFTDDQGSYSFGVAAGNTYQIALDLSTQWMQTTPGRATGPGLLGDVLQVADSPSAYPLGLTSDGTSLWHVGVDTQRLYRTDLATGALIGEFAVPTGTDIWDIQFDRQQGETTIFWGTDFANDRIVQFDTTGSILASVSVPPSSELTGVALAGDDLWIADWARDLIYQVDPTTGATMSSFQAPDSQVWGLTFDGRYLWTNGRESHRTYALDPATGAVVRSFTLSSLERPDGAGVAWDGQALWIALLGDGKLVRTDVAMLESLTVQVGQDGAPVVVADFGICRLGSVSGVVFNDTSRDGLQQATETGLEGWRIYLDLDGDGKHDIGEKSALSGPTGLYELTNLRPGDVALRQVLRQPGYEEGPTVTMPLSVDGSGQPVERDFADRWIGIGPVGPEFRVNTTAATDMCAAAVAMDDLGNSVVIWEGPSTNSVSPLYAQRFNAVGVPLGPEFFVANVRSNVVNGNVVAMSGEGKRFVIAWHEPTGIYAQRYDSSGVRLGSRITVAANRSSEQRVVNSVTMDQDGDFAVGYFTAKPRQWDSTVFFTVQRYYASGALWGKALVFNQTGAPHLTYTHGSVAMGPDGSFVVAWQETNNLYAQRYDASGKAVGGRVTVGSMVMGGNHLLDVVADASGGFAAVWHDTETMEPACRAFNADGTPRGNKLSIVADEWRLAVAMQDNGDFMLTWKSGKDVFAQRFTRMAQPKDPVPFVVNTTRAGGLNDPAAAMSAAGNMVIVWSGYGANGIAGVLGQRYSAPPATTLANTSLASAAVVGKRSAGPSLLTQARAAAQVESRAVDMLLASRPFATARSVELPDTFGARAKRRANPADTALADYLAELQASL